ncbi:Metal regulatory transcription factor 1 [Escovopsis weberi]|uniref:Metal regulatory transcription factor 1 n=1 Tax=Escovopsis weberi TaxID=150374 RepID=A0A0M8MVG6_ESCWE|nr:Metal regulatory transcription factor 1 [Escovopsis weberi]
MAATAGGMFSFASTEPSADLLHGSSWAAAGEGSQNLHDYPDSGSSHSGEAEEYIFVSGHSSPGGSRLDHSQVSEASWAAPKTAMPPMAGAEAMSRASSSRSNGSAISHAHMPSMGGVRGGGAPVFRNGSQAAGPMAGMDSCLLLDSAHVVTPHMYWPEYTLDMGLHAEGVAFPSPVINPLHVVPAQMHLGQDSVPETPSPSTWDCFSSSISRTSSPATIDENWPPAPLSPASSPDLCPSPTRYVVDGLPTYCSYQHGGSNDRNIHIFPDNLRKNSVQSDDMTHGQPFATRRQGSDGESARDHALYKNVSTQDDGLFHCPWEGSTSCNHKPEKLKCNYDKFVDSHLKPYRCKAEACEGARFSSTACLLRHEREAHGLHGHGDKPFLCMYKGCERSIPGSGFPRQWNLRDHMKRVHNDHGSAGNSPPAGPAQQPAKGRKRKSDASEHPVPSRKNSVKSMPAEQKQPPVKPLLEQWLDQRKAVEDLLRRMDKPEAQQLDEVQKRLASMAKMAANIPAALKVEVPATGRRAYVTSA